MNYGVVVEYDDVTDRMPWLGGNLEDALAMRDKYVAAFEEENLTGAKRVYVIYGERVVV